MAGTDEHTKLLHLFDLVLDSKSTEEEAQHIRECEECQRVREVFARQFGKPHFKGSDESRQFDSHMGQIQSTAPCSNDEANEKDPQTARAFPFVTKYLQ